MENFILLGCSDCWTDLFLLEEQSEHLETKMKYFGFTDVRSWDSHFGDEFKTCKSGEIPSSPQATQNASKD